MSTKIFCLSVALLVVTAQIGSVFSDGNFVASVASSSSGPQGGHVFTATYPGPGGKPQVQGTSWPGPDGGFSLDNRNGPAVAGASANSGKGNSGRKPVRPGGSAGGSVPNINALPTGNPDILSDKSVGSGVKVQTSPSGVSVSSSSSANSGVSSIGIRGSFGGGDEDVEIEVNGQQVPVPKGSDSPAGKPAYSGPGANNNVFGNANSFAGANAGGYGAGQPVGQYPYGGLSPMEYFNQYFALMRAQQEAFQRQLQALILQQQNANPYVPSMNFGSGFPNAGGFPYSGGASFGGSGAMAGASASAGASVGPNGGFQHAQISPASPGIESRFGEGIPPPSGGSFGVFSSSSSSSQIGPDGKPITNKEATIGVNDNGKVTVHTVRDP